MAEQKEPVRRKVALKIIKLGMDTKQVIARFEAERQALAMMDHPNIARVLDAGATDSGRPYFVMELVKGVPITDYCDTESLSTKDRLDLFINVCHAVQHAHQKGIIHRDIKPSNVMVTLHDGKPVPKVIDFGIAKATNRELTDKTLFTEYGQLIGTPQYMSPEQAEMSGLDIDTRSDIYSLGVLLYELLTGTTPFDPQRLRRAALGEIQRIIREEEPPKPSTRRSTLASEPRPSGSGSSSVAKIAKHRRTEPGHLARQLRGDLDWIIMKSLEKERARRYETANGLAADIQRHLSDEPVLASPPSAAYRVRKFARRNKPIVLGVSAVIISLAVGLGLALSFYVASEAQRRRANAEAATSAKVTQALQNMLSSINPARAHGKELTVRELLDQAGETLDDELADQPDVQEALRQTIVNTYESLFLGRAASPHAQWLIEYARRKYGPDDPKTIDAIKQCGFMYFLDDQHDRSYDYSLEAYLITLKTLGREHPMTIGAMTLTGLALMNTGDLQNAAPLLTGAMELAKRHPPGSEDLFYISYNLTRLYWMQGRLDEAEQLLKDCGELGRRIWGHEQNQFLHRAAVDLARVYKFQGRLVEAEAQARIAVQGSQNRLGEYHRVTFEARQMLAEILDLSSGKEEADSIYDQLLDDVPRQLGDDHRYALEMRHAFALRRQRQGLHDARTEALYLDLLERRKRVLGEEHRDTLSTSDNLGWLYNEQGRFAEAEALHRRTLEIRRRVLGELDFETNRSRRNLTISLNGQGKIDESRQLNSERLSMLRARAEAGDASAGDLNEYAWLLLTIEPEDLRDPDVALEFARRANDLTNYDNALYLDTLALAYHMTGDTPRSLETQQEALSLLTANQESHRPEMEANLAKYIAALEPGAEDD